MISSRVGCRWNPWQRPASRVARTSSNDSHGTMSGRDSHVFSVYGVRSVRLSAAVTKRCSDTAGEAFMQSMARTVTERRKPFRPVRPHSKPHSTDLTHLSVELPKTYVTRDDYRSDLKEIKDMLGKIFDRLEGKAVKS